MRLRNDSLAAAARAIQAVEQFAAGSGTGTTVGTVGMLLNHPNVANVVPGLTVFTIDLRDTDADALEQVGGSVLQRIERIAEECDVRVEIDFIAESVPVVLSRRLREALSGSAESQGIDYLEMPSGAVHDALEVARTTDAAMVFVPSIGGRSHCPEEDTSCESIALGVDVLAGAVQGVGEGSG